MNDDNHMSKEDTLDLFNKYICQIPFLYQKALFECEQPKLFCAALVYASMRLAASLSISKQDLASIFKDALEQYDDSIDEAEIIRNKLREALNEAMKIIGENEKDPEVK